MSGRTFTYLSSYDDFVRQLLPDMQLTQRRKSVGIGDNMLREIEEFINRFCVTAINDDGDLSFDAAGTYTFNGNVVIAGGGDLKSSNYVFEDTGWRLTAAGNAEFNGQMEVGGPILIDPSAHIASKNYSAASAGFKIDGNTGVGDFSSGLIVNGSFTVDTTTLVVNPTNNRVGIGTTSPGEPLHIVTGSGDAYLKQENGTTTTYLGPDSANTGLFGTSTAHAVRFITNNSERLRILSDGKVGIGTTSPNNLLSFGTPANGSRQIGLYENGTAHYGMGTDVNRLAIYASNSAGTAERVTVTSGGDVGINDTSPSYKLDVNGNLRSTSHIDVTSGTNNQLRLTANTTTARPYLQFTNYNGSSYVRRGYIGYPAAGSSTADINIVADNGDVIISPELKINGGPKLSDPSSANYLRITSAYGNIDLGPQNSSFAHIYTDRSSFYFNKNINLGGVSSSEGGEMVLQNATSYSLDWKVDNFQNQFRIFNSSLSNGDFRILYLNTTTGNNTVRWTSSGQILRYTSLTERKTDIESIDGILGYLNERNPLYDLSPKLFHEKDQPNADGEADNTTRGEYIYGMLAEDVYEVLPELCNTDGRGKLNGFAIESLIPLLVAEVQRLGEMVETLYGVHDSSYVPPVPRPTERADDEKRIFAAAIPGERAEYNDMRDYIISKYDGVEGREGVTMPAELPPLEDT